MTPGIQCILYNYQTVAESPPVCVIDVCDLALFGHMLNARISPSVYEEEDCPSWKIKGPNWGTDTRDDYAEKSYIVH